MTHALTGAAAGLVFAPVIAGYADVAPLDLAVIALVTTGASYAPDIDHPQATIAQTFGWATKSLTRFVGRVSGGHRHKTHTILGAFVFGVVAWFLSAFGGFLGGQLADALGAGTGMTDVAGQVGQYLAVICCLGLGVGALGLTSDGMSSTVGMFAGCGGFVLATASAGVTYEWVPAAVVVGCCAHLLGDLATKQGVMLLWPFSSYRFKIAWITTGKWVEVGVVAPLLTVGVVAAAVYRLGYWPQTWGAVQGILAAAG